MRSCRSSLITVWNPYTVQEQEPTEKIVLGSAGPHYGGTLKRKLSTLHQLSLCLAKAGHSNICTCIYICIECLCMYICIWRVSAHGSDMVLAVSVDDIGDQELSKQLPGAPTTTLT